MRKYLILAGFISLGVTLGYALISVPNVELVTATVFLGGYVLGVRLGLLGGIVTETIYGIMNPQGLAAPPLLAGMVIAMGIIGAMGGLFTRITIIKSDPGPVFLAAAGFICTLIFELLTSLGYFISVQMPAQRMAVGLIAGLPFYFVHLLSNILIFLILVPLLIRRLQSKMSHLVITVLLAIHVFSPSDLPAKETSLPPVTEPVSNYRHLGDLTQTLPGVFYRDLGYGGEWAGIRLSGMALNQSAMLLNGFQLKDPITGMTDMRWIPVDMIDTLFVADNTNTAGNRALAVETRGVPTSQAYTRAVYRPGSNHFSDIDLTFGQKYTARFLLMSGFLLNHEGEQSGYGSHRQQIRSIIQWQPWHSLKFSYIILSNVFKSDTEYPLSFPKDSTLAERPNLKTDRTDHMFRCTWFTGQHPLQLSWHYTRIRYGLRDRNASQSSSGENEKWIRGTDLFWSLEQCLPLSMLPVTWKVTAEQQGVHMTKAGLDQWQWTASLNTNFALSSNFQFEGKAGYYTGTGNTAFGSVKLVTRPAGFNLWLGFSRSYRAPVVAERSGDLFLPTIPENGDELTLLHYSYRTASNRNLVPELFQILETGGQWHRSGLALTLRGYIRQSSDIIALSFRDDRLIWDNSGTRKTAGFEAGIQAAPWKNITASLIYNMFQNVENRTELERPNLWGRAALAWRRSYFEADLDLQVILQAQFWSDYYSFSGFGLESGTIYNTGNGLIYGKIIARFMKRAIVSFSMDNILNTSIFINNEIMLPGRIYRLSYVWELLN